MHNTTLEEQRIRILAPQPEVKLHAACKINEGIIELSDDQRESLREAFFATGLKTAFFIPASGSGSRMFEFLFDFISNPNETNRGAVERFLNHIEDFAFFYQFPLDIQEQLRNRTMEIDAFVAYILNNKGMGLAHLPKGLVPFHKNGPFLLNPFQEHVLQGSEIAKGACTFHFSIRPNFKTVIEEQLRFLEGMTGKRLQVEYSEQNPATDAYAFNKEGDVFCLKDGQALKRPAGHGALLENLESVDADLIFIKNIDNVQHLNKSKMAIEAMQELGGLLLQIREEIAVLIKNPSLDAINALNQRYQLFHASSLTNDVEQLIAMLQRPIRVCGFVKNEGQPGGGPFWISENGQISKQIIEKAQIGLHGDQYRVMIQSTHFNPVLMVCEGRKADGTKINFEAYKDDSKYFIVNKKHEGNEIKYVELPGLWNGSMADWNSLFVEVKSETFSPVKTILDLLEPAHQA